jgi:hypothetical protein
MEIILLLPESLCPHLIVCYKSVIMLDGKKLWLIKVKIFGIKILTNLFIL